MNTTKTIPVGKYTAKIESWSVAPPAGDPPLPAIVVTFMTDLGPVNWRGNLKEGRVREITIKTLVSMGFRGTNLREFANPDGDTLDRNLMFEITIEHYDGKRGGKFATVRYVNPVGGNKYAGVPVQEADALLGGLDIRGELHSASLELGIALPNAPLKNITRAQAEADLDF
jgi:hypothetical protein